MKRQVNISDEEKFEILLKYCEKKIGYKETHDFLEKVMDDFIKLSDMVGADACGWRYDPIFVSETYTVDRHISEQVAQRFCILNSPMISGY